MVNIAVRQRITVLISMVSLMGLFVYSYIYNDWMMFLWSYLYYKIVVGMFGNQIAQHRYFSHMGFQTTRPKEIFLYCIALTTGIDPISYALGHRHHHKYSDTERDRHSPYNKVTDVFSPILMHVLFRAWSVHCKLPGSYTNFDTNDRSWNNKFIQLLDWGEGLHNNHHRFPNRYNQAVMPNEVDPVGWLVKKLFVKTT